MPFKFNPFTKKLDITNAVGGGGEVVETLTGNSGVATSSSNNINIVTANSTVKFVGSGSTLTQDFGLTNLTLGSSLPALTSGDNNISLGKDVLKTLTSGSNNIGAGSLTLQAITSGSSNVVFGFGAGRFLTTGSNNFLLGTGSGTNLTTSASNIGIGSSSLGSFTTGTSNAGSNIGIGATAFPNLQTGIFNIGFGSSVGNTYTGAESSNILFSNIGVTGESNTIRLGTQGTGNGQQNKAFLAGVTGTTVASSAPVGVDTNGQISSLGFGTSSQVLTSTGAASSPTWQAPASQFTPNSVVTIFDDFFSNETVTSGLAIGQQVWTPGNAGNWTSANGVATNAHPGVIGHTLMSVAATNRSLMLGPGTTAPLSGFVLGGGEIILNWVFNITALSNGTNRYTLNLGIGDTLTTVAVANGCWISYSDNVNSGNWTFNTSAASSATNSNSAVAVTTGWHNAQVTINAAGTLVTFVMDGVTLGTIALTIPTLGILPFLSVLFSAGSVAAGTIQIDLFYLKQTLTTAR